MVLFPAFQAIDVFGRLVVLNILALQRPLHTSLLSSTLEPVSTKPTVMNVSGSNFCEPIVPTHTFDAPLEDLVVLFVPGGIETRGEALVAPAVEFVGKMYPRLGYLVSVCTGATIVAKTGLLFLTVASWVQLHSKFDHLHYSALAYQPLIGNSPGPNANWIPQARWVADGNIWSSPGVSTGIDVAYAFIAALYWDDVAGGIANSSDCVRWLDPNYDPFAAVWNVMK